MRGVIFFIVSLLWFCTHMYMCMYSCMWLYNNRNDLYVNSLLIIYFQITANFFAHRSKYCNTNRNIICLNFLDEAWCVNIFVCYFSDCCPHLYDLLFVTQRFGRCIFRPSSGVSCLPGHGNDLTCEIILKLWLLVKRGDQEIWCYSSNDIIVFTPIEKHHKRFV